MTAANAGQQAFPSKGLLSSTARSGHRAELPIAFLIGAAAMALVQSGSIRFPGNDSYYHLKMARLLPSMGFPESFPWLHWTIFRDQFVSHHYGFHVLLAPFVWLSEAVSGGLLWGGKVFVAAAMGATAALFTAILRVLRVDNRIAWVLLLCCLPWHFWLRMSYVRAPVAALPLFLGAVWCLLRHRPILLGVLAFACTHLYGGFVLFPVLPLAFVAGHLLTGSMSRRHLACGIAAVIGIVIAFVLNPYFPENLTFLRTQLFETGLGAPRNVGNEWRPLRTWFFLRMSAPLAIVWFLALVILLRSPRPVDGNSLALLFLNIAFLCLTLKARRFIEYWPVFALLNAAVFARPAAQRLKQVRKRPFLFPVARALGATVLIAAAGATLLLTRSHVRPHRNYTALEGAMRHIGSVSTAGSLVFTDDWDLFPAAFYCNDHNIYAVGLDPVFTQRRYPELWERYKLITRGKTPCKLPRRFQNDDRPRVTLRDIGDVFDAGYVLVADDHPRLYRQLAKATDRFRLIYPAGPTDDSAAQPPFAAFEVLNRSATDEPPTPSSNPEPDRVSTARRPAPGGLRSPPGLSP